MQIASDGVNVAVREADKVACSFLQKSPSFQVFHVANVLADEGFVFMQYTGGAVEFAAQSQNATLFSG